VFSSRLTGTQRRVARRIFLQLTELGEGAPDTRRRASIGELIGQPEEESAVRDVLQVLADARLVTLDACTAEVAQP